MNAVIQAIKKRRSVRSYTRDRIPHEVLETLLEAATWAPTGANMQQWRFVVVESPEMLERFITVADEQYWAWANKQKDSWLGKIRAQLDQTLSADDPDYDPVFYGGSAIVWVIATRSGAATECAAACQNMMLAAHSLGLASCWVGFGNMARTDPELEALLELGEKEKPLEPIVFGYPKDVTEAPEKKPAVVKWL